MIEAHVDYLNIEYFLVHALNFLSGVPVERIPHGLIVFVEWLVLFGMLVSIVLVVFIVYAQMRLHHVEHEGFHAMEADAHAHHDALVEHPGKNERWERIIAWASGGNESEWRRAILEADIMLGVALGEWGYPGDSVGEQLRHANPIQMTTLDLAWKAHKVRNEVAHGGDTYHLSERDMQTAITNYRTVFEELGAI